MATQPSVFRSSRVSNSGGHLLKRTHLAPVLVIVLLLVSAGSPFAQDNTIVHFSGFGYEAGGFDWSYPNDELHLIAEVTSMVGPLGLPYAPGSNEYTLVVTGLSSNGEIDYGNYSTVVYNLGFFEIYQDPSFNADWNEFPTIPIPPSTFFDGELWLSGEFYEFGIVLFRDQGFGSYEGSMTLSGGSARSWFGDEAYLFGGELQPPHNPGIPPGYDMSLDGEVWIDQVAVDESNFSKIKALY